MPVSDLPTSAASGAPIPEVDLGQTESQRVSAKTLVEYGDSGLGKTTELLKAAKYYYAKTRKPVRLISAEDSTKLIFQPFIDAGVVEGLFITKSANPIKTFRALALGQWPVYDVSGAVTGFKPWDGTACAYLIEGLTSISEQMLEYMRENHLFLREQKSDAVDIGGTKIASASQTAFGVTQSEMLAILKGFANIPGIERVIWTSHEVGATEEGTGNKLRGPALVGSAKTPHIQKYIGTLLHVDDVLVDGVKKPRVYFVRHADPQFAHITYPAKVTMPPDAKPKLLAAFPGGFYDPTLDHGLDKFLETEEALLQTATSDAAAWKARIDGLKQKSE